MADYDQQKGETAKAFHAFCQYRDYGPERSIAKAIEQHNADHTTAQFRLWVKWSSKNGWVERAKAWDKRQDKLFQQRLTHQIQQDRLRHIQMGQRLQLTGAKIMERMDPGTLSARKAIDYLQVASNVIKEGVRIEREALGEPGEIAEQRHGGQVEVKTTPQGEELDKLISEKIARIRGEAKKGGTEPGDKPE